MVLPDGRAQGLVPGCSSPMVLPGIPAGWSCWVILHHEPHIHWVQNRNILQEVRQLREKRQQARARPGQKRYGCLFDSGEKEQRLALRVSSSRCPFCQVLNMAVCGDTFWNAGCMIQQRLCKQCKGAAVRISHRYLRCCLAKYRVTNPLHHVDLAAQWLRGATVHHGSSGRPGHPRFPGPRTHLCLGFCQDRRSGRP